MLPITDHLPNAVRLRAAAVGKQGTDWLAQLDSAIAALAQKWQVTFGLPLNGSTESVVLPATLQDGSQAIVKFGLPTICDTALEAHILNLANGRGYVECLQHDAEHNAIMLERLGPTLASLNLPIRDQLEHMCQTFKAAWIPLEQPQGLMTGAEKAHWLADFIHTKWLEYDKPCSVAAHDQALAYAESRAAAHDPTNCVLVHGDVHNLNTLQSTTGDGYKFVDPDGLFAEPAYDLSVPMREWAEELLAGDALQLGLERCAHLADLTGLDQTAIWQWGFIERVSTGLTLIQIGMPEMAVEYLQVADLWAKAP